jgi:hypothetical protein
MGWLEYTESTLQTHKEGKPASSDVKSKTEELGAESEQIKSLFFQYGGTNAVLPTSS